MALPVLAVRLDLATSDGVTAASESVAAWIRKRHGLGVAPFRPARFRAAGDIPDLASQELEAAGIGRCWAVRIVHPGTDDPTWTWLVDIWLTAPFGPSDSASLTTRVSVQNAVTGRIAAPDIEAGRPGFVAAVIETLGLTADGIPIGSVSHPSAESIPNFAAFLDRDDRLLPVVAVAQGRDGPAAADDHADDLLNRLGGIAHVVRLDGQAAWALSELLPPGSGCFSGALRIYWPGRVSQDASHRHPLWVSRRVEQVGWELVRKEIVERVGIQSAASIGPPDLLARLRRAASRSAAASDDLRRREREQLLAGFRARDAEARRLKDEMGAGAAPAEAREFIDDILAELQTQLTANESLEEQLQAERLEKDLALEANQDLEARVAVAEQNLQDVYLATPGHDEPAAQNWSALSVEQVFGEIRKQDGALVLSANAETSWAKSPSSNPERVRDALVLMNQAATQWREADGSVGQQLSAWMGSEFGLDLALGDEPLIRLGKEHFTFEGRDWSQEPHLKLGDHTSPNNVARIYFAIDKHGLRWIINHVGLKLYGL